MKAIVLLSGGLDSTTALALALAEGREVFPIAFDYKQRHRRELVASAQVVAHYASKGAAINSLRVVGLAGLDFGTSALTSALAVPQDRDEATMSKEIPVTYVPARNSIFLSIGTAFAEALGADEVWTGFNAVDYSGYPDCRPEYVSAMQSALALGTKRGVNNNPISLRTPIIHLSKVDIVRRALSHGAPLGYTWSCYVGQDTPCGRCDSCAIRRAAFEALGTADPAVTS